MFRRLIPARDVSNAQEQEHNDLLGIINTSLDRLDEKLAGPFQAQTCDEILRRLKVVAGALKDAVYEIDHPSE